jgi:hypothetical protein
VADGPRLEKWIPAVRVLEVPIDCEETPQRNSRATSGKSVGSPALNGTKDVPGGKVAVEVPYLWCTTQFGRKMQDMNTVEHENFGTPSETRIFPHGKAEILNMGDGTIGRLTLEPGWRWSNDVKPIAGTESCEAPHFQYHVSGQLAIRMDDGTEFVAGPGDITSLPQGHDAWVVGDETVVTVDWFGAVNYAKASE